MTTPAPKQVKLTEDQYERIELLIDNAATASQCREMLRDDDGIESGLREAVRMNVAEPLMRELAALRASSQEPEAFRVKRGSGSYGYCDTREDAEFWINQSGGLPVEITPLYLGPAIPDVTEAVESAGERGNKAGPAFSGSLHAGFKAPSSGSLPNTSGTVTPATPPAPGKKPLSQILEEARASDVYKAEAAALEAAAPAVPGTPQEVEALAKALEDIEHDTSCELNQRGSFIAIRVCDCTHPDRTKAATLLRTLSADLAALKADNTEQIRFKWELATDLAAAQQERDEALYRECDWERRARQAETDWAAMKDAFVAAEARAEKAEHAAEQARATAMEDTQRLDALENETIIVMGSDRLKWQARRVTDSGITWRSWYHADTLREAIDAALSAQATK